jgi:hypothetical protein
MSPNTRKIIAAVIALILVVAMVLPMALSALR